MKALKRKNVCRTIRGRIYNFTAEHFGLSSGWMLSHIASCPRCRKRFAAIGRVELALAVLKSQPHQLDLLKRANTQAVNVLKHALRTEPKADRLKKARPEPGLLAGLAKYKNTAVNAAACLLLAMLFKAGVFNSAEKIDSQGRKTLHAYYVKNVGSELSDEIFNA